MAKSLNSLVPVSLLTLIIAPICFSMSTHGGPLYPQFYKHSCPNVEKIIWSVVAKAVAKERRMAASLLRLHFHDCFVKGCDGGVLLDSSGSLISEKRSNPNRNSARGFEVIDEIKAAVEKECPETVSYWWTKLGGTIGRRDTRDASLSGSNYNIPAPNNTFQTIHTKFKLKGLDLVDFVALSGSHTIGDARCTSFRQRLYNQSGNGQPDNTLDQAYAAQLRTSLPPVWW
ncbi:Peroxidase 72 [Bienertia sinuspersici]